VCFYELKLLKHCFKPDWGAQWSYPLERRPELGLRRILRDGRVNQLLDEVDEKEAAAEKEFSHRKATKHVAGMKQAISDLIVRFKILLLLLSLLIQ
jgi:hypothetical protein